MKIGRFPYQKLTKYPHMKPLDAEVWERFLKKEASFFDTVDYDVCVGKGADFLPTDENTPDGRENKLYQKKIDVVGYRNDSVWLVEVKPEADTRALGQILTYYSLYFKQVVEPREIVAAVCCGKVSDEMLAIFNENNVHVLVAK